MPARFPDQASEPWNVLTQQGVLCQLGEGKLYSPCLGLGQEGLLIVALLEDVLHLGVDPLQPGGELGQLSKWFSRHQGVPGVIIPPTATRP